MNRILVGLGDGLEVRHLHGVDRVTTVGKLGSINLYR
jgi:hypothetical protein